MQHNSQNNKLSKNFLLFFLYFLSFFSECFAQNNDKKTSYKNSFDDIFFTKPNQLNYEDSTDSETTPPNKSKPLQDTQLTTKSAKNRHSLNLSLEKISGKADEFVFSGAKMGSHLEWEFINVKMLSLDYKFKISDLFAIRTKFSNSIDGGRETRMVDSDWIGDGYDGYIDRENWTDRSFSKLIVDKIQQFKIEGSLNLFRDELKLNLGFNYDEFKMHDFGGEYIYSTDSSTKTGFRNYVGKFDEEVGISYRQTFATPYIGIGYQKELFNKRVLFNIFGNYSEYARAEAVDNHYSRNLEFTDSFKNGKYFNLGFNLDYQIIRNLYLGAGYEYTYYPLNRGDSLIKNTITKHTTLALDAAGLKNRYEKLLLNLKYNF